MTLIDDQSKTSNWDNSGDLRPEGSGGPRSSFAHTPGPDPHRERAQAILTKYPEARALMGPAKISALVIIGLTLAQLSLALLLRDASVAVILAVAYLVGAVLSFDCLVMIHEAGHGLIFTRRIANRLIAQLANLPLIVPVAERFRIVHGQHHAHMGEYERDVQLPRRREAAWVGNSSWRKLLWLCAYPFAHPYVVTRVVAHPRPPPRWQALNICAQLVFVVAMLRLAGGAAVLYLVASVYFATGPHPVGIRSIQEHERLANGQQTNSYYGPFNWLSFNVGYHTEHHDLPSVPWCRLPRLRRLAPEFFRDRATPRSWTRTFLSFVFDPRRTLWDRSLRSES
jgi:sphingolipid delta-4 desaturase